MTIKDYVLPKI